MSMLPHVGYKEIKVKKLYFLLLIVLLSSMPVFGLESDARSGENKPESMNAGTVQADMEQSSIAPLPETKADIQDSPVLPAGSNKTAGTDTPAEVVPPAAGEPDAAAKAADMQVPAAMPGAADSSTVDSVPAVTAPDAEKNADVVKATESEKKESIEPQTAVETESANPPAQPEAAQPVAPSSITKVESEAADSVVEMNEPTQRTKRRAFSLHAGLSIAASAATNAVSLTDFLQKEMVIDLPKLAKHTIRSGIHAGNTAEVGLFWQFTVLEEHTVRFSTMVDENLWVNIPKSLLELAAKGNAANAQGKPIEGDFNAKLNAFVDTGILYQMKKPKYSISARLAYFLPVAYMENPKIHYSIKPAVNDKTGQTDGLVFEANGTAQVYGSILAGLYDSNFPSVTDILKNGGIDLSISGSYRPASWVNITGGIDYLPLKVVTTNKGIQARFEATGRVNNIIGTIGNGLGNIFSYKIKGPTISTTDLPEKKIMRPGKIRIGADFQPFENNYLIVSPFIAFPFVNAKPYYIDGGIKVESRFAKVLGASFSTACIERIWRHELALFLDSRFFSLNFAASIASQGFARTFYTLSGLGFRFGIGIGL